MQWKPKRKDPYRAYRNWQIWFAWYPVKIDDTWIWLESVRRIRRSTGFLFGPCYWQHELIEK
jgi:hypothetical protein